LQLPSLVQLWQPIILSTSVPQHLDPLHDLDEHSEEDEQKEPSNFFQNSLEPSSAMEVVYAVEV
jgi:hypothetical protein